MGNAESILVSVSIPALKLSGIGKQLQTFPYQPGLAKPLHWKDRHEFGIHCSNMPPSRMIKLNKIYQECFQSVVIQMSVKQLYIRKKF